MRCPHCDSDNLPGNATCSHCKQDLTTWDRPVPCNRVERSLMEDRVEGLKPPPPPAVSPETTIRAAVGLMLDSNVGALVVVDAGGRLLGILSERDLLKKVAGIHEPYADLPVGPFMTPRPETVAPADTLNYALHKMDAGGYRHVPVLEDGRPVGVVSVHDMLRHITRLCKDPQG
jgi:CBS domain-containing protein